MLVAEEIEDCFDPTWHLKHVDTIFDRLGLNIEVSISMRERVWSSWQTQA